MLQRPSPGWPCLLVQHRQQKSRARLHRLPPRLQSGPSRHQRSPAPPDGPANQTTGIPCPKSALEQKACAAGPCDCQWSTPLCPDPEFALLRAATSSAFLGCHANASSAPASSAQTLARSLEYQKSSRTAEWLLHPRCVHAPNFLSKKSERSFL